MRRKIRQALPLVTKPNQYLGNELNACVKDPNTVDLTFVLAYPDTYLIGMSHLGLKILYHILNRRGDALAERVYAPWVDMESQMRKRGIPLFSLEGQRSVREFDVLGFTLQYELNFTNLLNMLDLAGIPLYAEDRDESYPLILAGGTCASNPEPLAEFIDAFLVGDGEEAVEEIADLLIEGKRDGWDRRETLIRLAGLRGVYVPSLYRAEYDEQEHFRTLVPLADAAPDRIESRIIKGLTPNNYPQHPLVPLTEIAHDRLSVEIMRGCSQGCRYCHAGMVYRPVREKSPEDILKEVVDGIANSGWDEISLVSLSSSDYSCLLDVINEINRLMADQKVALSLPSMRPDTFSNELARAMKDVRRTGLTFAPEAGSARLRRVINKSFREEDLLRTLQIAFDNGWESVKLYFMIGLPSEQHDDLNGIVELGRSVHRLSRKRGKKDLHLSISPFTPKPHTPFQWEKQDSVELLEKKSRYLKSRLPRRGMRVKWRDPNVSFFEGVFARGDRRLGRVLHLAWQAGCTFDSWSEHFDPQRWMGAFSKAGVDPNQYTAGRGLEDALPWGHIEYGARREYLRKERDKALQGELTRDCRKEGCHGCGAHRDGIPRLGEVSSQDLGSTPEKLSTYGRGKKLRAKDQPQMARSKMRIRYSKLPPVQYLSHLDLIRAFERSIRRAELPIAYSEGFHPHPKIAFGPPLPLGLTSTAEFLDMQFDRPLRGDLVNRLSGSMPAGLKILAATAIFRKTQSLAAAINVAEYRADLDGVEIPENLDQILDGLLAAEHLPIKRSFPRETKEVDIRGKLLDLRLEEMGRVLKMRLRTGEGGHVRPQEILRLILPSCPEDLLSVPIERTDQLIEREGETISPMEAV
ncbi:TIGR03960 family B12-binding radical SAM protein [Candidatus Zixiibacteriota bacterium]